MDSVLPRGTGQVAKGEQKLLLPGCRGEPHSSPSASCFALSAQACEYYGQQNLVPVLILVGVEGFMAWEVKDSWR